MVKIALSFLVACGISVAACSTSMGQTASSAPAPAESKLTPQECLARVKSMEPVIPKILEASKNTITTLMPDPATYGKTLPPLAKIVATGDKLNLKNYGGLAEGYYYSGNKTKGEEIYTGFAANADKVLGTTDTFPAGVAGDIGILYFSEQNYSAAEPFLLSSIKRLEPNLTAANANNLVAGYLCMALIRDKQGKAAEADTYAKKFAELAIKQRTQKL